MESAFGKHGAPSFDSFPHLLSEVRPYSPDTVNYFHYAACLFDVHPWDNIYSRAVNQEKLLKGVVVVVIFREDERLISFARENGVLISKYPEGNVLFRD